jgi:hypothetical protein
VKANDAEATDAGATDAEATDRDSDEGTPDDQTPDDLASDDIDNSAGLLGGHGHGAEVVRGRGERPPWRKVDLT